MCIRDRYGTLSGTAPDLTYTPDANYNGQDIFVYKALDLVDESPPAEVSITVELVNDAPLVDAGGPYVVDEGDLITVMATGSDVDGDPLAYAWDLNNDDVYETSGQSATFPPVIIDGPHEQVIAVQVADPQGLISTDTAGVTVANVAPSVGAITAPLDPVQVNTEISVSADFSDPGILDTHTALWDWGDDTTSDGVVVESGGTGTVTGSHTYTAAGIYTITLTVNDDDGDSRAAVFDFIVIYDPDGGFVTGGGWIESPEGAYAPDPDLTGKANFGFVSKYKKGATTPSGTTVFHFKVADLHFYSDSYEWLVVTGGDYARFKGSGTINEQGDYKFLIWAGDKNPDTFRIRIWIEDELGNETDIYDNGSDQVIGGGSIVVHKK
jgi:PKD repeat protein